MPGRAHWVWQGSESKQNRHQCYTVSVGSVNFSLTSYLLQMFCSTMIAVSSKGSPVRAGEEILWENCCVGMTICWAQPLHIQFGSAPHLWVNWIHVCDISPVVLLSPDNLEDITGINDMNCCNMRGVSLWGHCPYGCTGGQCWWWGQGRLWVSWCTSLFNRGHI